MNYTDMHPAHSIEYLMSLELFLTTTIQSLGYVHGMANKEGSPCDIPVVLGRLVTASTELEGALPQVRERLQELRLISRQPN